MKVLFIALDPQPFPVMETELTEEAWKSIGIEIADLCIRAKFVNSKNEARRQIKAGAIKLNDFKISDPFARMIEIENERFLLEQVVL